MRRQIWNFLDGPARWETSVQGPVRGGPRDHLIIPFAPQARDVRAVAGAILCLCKLGDEAVRAELTAVDFTAGVPPSSFE